MQTTASVTDSTPAPRSEDSRCHCRAGWPSADWVKNVLAAQAARFSMDGHEIELQSPRLVKKKDLWPMVPTTNKSYPGISSESELLRMTSADKAQGPE